MGSPEPLDVDALWATLTSGRPSTLVEPPPAGDEPRVHPGALEAAYHAQLADPLVQGAFYTPPSVVAFMVRAALARWPGDPATLVLADPACGCGAFLVGAFQELLARQGGSPASARAIVATQLHGLDLDPGAVAVARWRLRAAQIAAGVAEPVESRVFVGDALLAPPPPFDGPGFDLVLANPPYVRAERLGALKQRLAARYAGCVGAGSDLSGYFLARGLELLRPGGLHVYLTSDSWLDVAYAATWRAHLLASAHLEAVYQGEDRAFAGAEIHPVVGIARVGPPPPGAVTHFVRLRGPWHAATPAATVVRRQADLAREGHWAGRCLRVPALYSELLDTAGRRLVPLASLAHVRRGWTTGANDFFFVRVVARDGAVVKIACDDGSTHRLEAACLGEPVVVKAGEIGPPRLPAQALVYHLARLPRELGDLPLARAYVAWGEAQGVAARPSVRARRPWWWVAPRASADLLVPIGHKRRPALAVGPGLHGSDNFVEVTLCDARHLPVVAASLLSAFTLLACEALGRANFGQGLLKTQTYEVAQLPVLDPDQIAPEAAAELVAAYEAMADRAPAIIYDEVQRPDRVRLDAAMLAAMGCAQVEVATLHASVCAVIRRRQARTARTPEARGLC